MRAVLAKMQHEEKKQSDFFWSARGRAGEVSENYNDELAYEQTGSRQRRTKMLELIDKAGSPLFMCVMWQSICRQDVLKSFPQRNNADVD